MHEGAVQDRCPKGRRVAMVSGAMRSKWRWTLAPTCRGCWRRAGYGQPMKAFVGVTDRDWWELLRRQEGLSEIDFWRPGGRRRFRALRPGQPLLFTLQSRDNFIEGGGLRDLLAAPGEPGVGHLRDPELGNDDPGDSTTQSAPAANWQEGAIGRTFGRTAPSSQRFLQSRTHATGPTEFRKWRQDTCMQTRPVAPCFCSCGYWDRVSLWQSVWAVRPRRAVRHRGIRVGAYVITGGSALCATFDHRSDHNDTFSPFTGDN